MTLYDRDFHAWAEEQAALARTRSGNALDWDNVAEELESLGRRERQELRSRYVILIQHLLKWLHQADGRTSSWRKTIRVQRKDIARHMRENPSLRAHDDRLFGEAHETARLEAAEETGLPERIFTEQPPFTPEQARDEAFWPETGSPAAEGRHDR